MRTELALALADKEITQGQYDNLKLCIDVGCNLCAVADLYDYYLLMNSRPKQKVTRGSNYIHIH